MLLDIADQHSKMCLMMLIFFSNLMNQTQITDAIATAFDNLSELSAQVYDYWISELYDDEGDLIAENWSEKTLKLMEDDVMQLTLVTEEN
jgi:hypothetical protein